MVRVRSWLVALGLLTAVEAADILSSSGFQVCGNGSQDITVTQFELNFDRSTNELVFAVAGNSQVSQNVTGSSLTFLRLTISYDKRNGTGTGEILEFIQPLQVPFLLSHCLKEVTTLHNYVLFLRDLSTQTGILLFPLNTSAKSHR
jgi:hypothetical protein